MTDCSPDYPDALIDDVTGTTAPSSPPPDEQAEVRRLLLVAGRERWPRMSPGQRLRYLLDRTDQFRDVLNYNREQVEQAFESHAAVLVGLAGDIEDLGACIDQHAELIDGHSDELETTGEVLSQLLTDVAELELRLGAAHRRLDGQAGQILKLERELVQVREQGRADIRDFLRGVLRATR